MDHEERRQWGPLCADSKLCTHSNCGQSRTTATRYLCIPNDPLPIHSPNYLTTNPYTTLITVRQSNHDAQVFQYNSVCVPLSCRGHLMYHTSKVMFVRLQVLMAESMNVTVFSLHHRDDRGNQHH